MVAEPSIVLVFLAGVLTVVTPCIIPILPPLLAGSVGSKLRPLAIVLGMSITFTLMGGVFSALGIAASAAGEAMRYFAIAFMIGFGAIMVDDELHQAYVKHSSSLVGRLSKFLPLKTGEDSLGGAFLLGLSLGIVWSGALLRRHGWRHTQGLLHALCVLHRSWSAHAGGCIWEQALWSKT
jgi:cytochrome c biogenesis protein CcdA